MQPYEKTIGLRTIWLTLVRRYKIVFLFFIPILAISYLGTKKVFKTSFQSSITIKRGGATISQDNHGKLMDFMTSSDTKTKVSEALAEQEKPIRIEPSQINLSYTTWKSGMTSINVTFASSNQTIAKEVMAAVKTYASNKDNYADSANFQFSEPSVATISKQKKYFIILTALGLMVSLGLAFYDEITSDEVYDVKDVSLFTDTGFEIDTKLA